ncbi:DUF5946 family protein [Saccharopolyspora indica]|uniref:DUF5946 family protein n=1 Tax=Saccharopolyspora indica TaxID=1229659 RepID=UPI0022EB209C|nr:DUF5946 family protein [Saccharopolyspora indica]MDA3648073.1 DUF5946 family protein [Saccharopolyspora indica]
MLALDHSRRPPWGPLHGVTVACFLLQHPRRSPASGRGRAWAILNTYVDEGLAATTRLTERVRRANSHRNSGAALPDSGPGMSDPPAVFGVTIADVARDGTFPADGFPERVTAWAEDTITAWRGASGGR